MEMELKHMFDVAWFDYDNSVQSGNETVSNEEMKIVDEVGFRNDFILN